MTSKRPTHLGDVLVDMHHRSESSQPLLYDSPSSPRSPPRTPWTPTFSVSGSKPILANAPLRRLLVLIAAFSTLTILAFASVALLSAPPLAVSSTAGSTSPQSQQDINAPQYDNASDYYSPFVLGPPTESFRDNLREDVQYITSWISAGWSTCPVLCVYHPTITDRHSSCLVANDVMTYMNLIYLGVITSRVPIIPMFTPSHVRGANPVPFGDVFDVERFIDESGIDIVEWRDVKNPDSEVVDDLGCWNIWEVTNAYEANPRGSFVTLHLRLGKFPPSPVIFDGRSAEVLPQISRTPGLRNGSR